jgi:flagella basal body P-ring formation protein FlgA
MIPLGAFLLASCLALNSATDQVTAADLAPGFPGMETLDAGTPLAVAPVPGVARVFHLADLGRLAERFHLPPPPAEICVERPLAPLDLDKALAAMRASLPEADISILDWSRTRVPAGEIAFPPKQLHNGPSGQLWNGYVRYGGAGQFSIWARVSVQVTAVRVVAVRDLPPGQAIPADAVQNVTREDIPGAVDFALSIDQVAGKWPRALIRAGTPVRINQLAKPVDVARGDTVQVDAQSGAAHLEFAARAEGSGATGDTIPVTNPVSHRRFTARVAGKGRVWVDDSVAQGKS